MPSDCISYQESGYFTPLIVDYLNQKENLKPLYHRFPTLDNFKAQIEEKQQNYPAANREVLVKVLQEQYETTETSELTRKNIQLLQDKDTFTVTTGHQLNLFTGPLYFLYKIVSAINLAKELKDAYPNFNFVPVYWMATEDHDFEEINYFSFRNRKIKWNRESAGPVGRLSTEGLTDVLEVFKKELGPGANAQKLADLFKQSYLNHDTLADATRYLANGLFGENGLVIIDADNAELKQLFIPHIKRELIEQVSHQKVAETAALLKDYNVQVNPRDINLFYIEDGVRERIIAEGEGYSVNNTNLRYSKEKILEMLQEHPERFSPNVIMRPLYQEVILPNLCYIGGGGELAYWLELKSFFEASGVTFPILLLRNSVLLASHKQVEKLDALGLRWADVFSPQQMLLNKKTVEYSQHTLDFSNQKEALKKQFKALTEVAAQTHASFTGAVKAQEKKQLKGLENLEKRLLRAEKKVHADKLQRVSDIQDELFPGKGLQERNVNFAEFYLQHDGALIATLLMSLKPLEQQFDTIVL
jgi:bacillithiol biosynthesis cysteine-adding enzyme BshC